MAVPKFHAFIDFDKDNDFRCANEDVTSDVRATSVYSWKLNRGVNLRKRRAEAASLELFLNNECHTYSPFNPASPLNDPCTNTSVFPAPDIWFMAGYPVDDFDRLSNGDTLLCNPTPSHDSNFAWEGNTVWFEGACGSIKPLDIACNNVTAVLDFGESCAHVGAQFTRGGTSSGLALRRACNCNYLLAYPDGCNIKLDKIECGAQSNVASAAFCWGCGAEKWLFADLHGDDIRISVDNSLVLDASTCFQSCVTKHGFGGRPVCKCDRWDCVGGWNSLFFGRIDSISPRPEVNNQYTYIRAFDDLERQNVYQVFRIAPAAPTSAKNIIGDVLNATGFGVDDCECLIDLGRRILDCGETLTHNCQHRKSMGRDALTELYQVQCDDVGLYYMDGRGYARYEDSCHRASVPHTTARATWTTNRPCDNECDKYISQGFQWDDGKERVENEVWYFYNKISEVSCGVEVWRLNDTSAILDDRPAVENGATFTTLAIGCGDVVACPITPVACTDFTVHTDKCGVGCNLSACVCASLTTGFEGNFRLVNLTNNSGQNGFVTFLRLRATKHTASAKAGARAENTTSQNDNGRRRLEHCSLHIDEFDTALDRAQKRVSLRARPKERVNLTMENGTKANLMEMLHRDISDKVTVTFDSLCINNDFHIEGYTLTGREGGLYINADWLLQEAFGGGWCFNRWQCCVNKQAAFSWA